MILFEHSYYEEYSPTEVIGSELGLISIGLITTLDFEWDQGNTDKIFNKHALSTSEVERAVHNADEYLGIFAQPKVRTEYGWESRYQMFVRINDRFLRVIFTFRQYQEEVVVRPISAHPIRRNEVYRVIRKQTALQWRQE